MLELCGSDDARLHSHLHFNLIKADCYVCLHANVLSVFFSRGFFVIEELVLLSCHYILLLRFNREMYSYFYIYLIVIATPCYQRRGNY